MMERLTIALSQTQTLSAKELSERLGVPGSSVRAALRDLIAKGDVEQLSN